jgi:hypothetical protein
MSLFPSYFFRKKKKKKMSTTFFLFDDDERLKSSEEEKVFGAKDEKQSKNFFLNEFSILNEFFLNVQSFDVHVEVSIF